MRRGPADQLSVLVTGVGAPVAVSIFKALRQSALEPRIVATDANPLSVGLFRADRAYVLPRIADGQASYSERLTEICLAESIAMVCFGSEIEMRLLAPQLHDVERNTGARLILNGPRFLEPFMDKWETVCLLREKGLPAPDTVLATDPDGIAAFLARHPFPLIVKPRHSSGSKNVFVVRTPRQLDFASGYVDEPVLQEYLRPDDQEYTVGIYKSPRTGYVGQVVMRRTLSAGLTYKAEVVRDEEIESVCRTVVESFDVWGPINVQLRKTPAGVRIFEINIRFSSSAVMRAHFGFNEPDMCLRDVVLGEELSEPQIRAGYALRYWDEIYLDVAEYMAGAEHPNSNHPIGTKGDDF
jgi:carbamoyl-phosphate synthase large subunit